MRQKGRYWMASFSCSSFLFSSNFQARAKNPCPGNRLTPPVKARPASRVRLVSVCEKCPRVFIGGWAIQQRRFRPPPLRHNFREASARISFAGGHDENRRTFLFSEAQGPKKVPKTAPVVPPFSVSSPRTLEPPPRNRLSSSSQNRHKIAGAKPIFGEPRNSAPARFFLFEEPTRLWGRTQSRPIRNAARAAATDF